MSKGKKKNLQLAPIKNRPLVRKAKAVIIFIAGAVPKAKEVIIFIAAAFFASLFSYNGKSVVDYLLRPDVIVVPSEIPIYPSGTTSITQFKVINRGDSPLFGTILELKVDGTDVKFENIDFEWPERQAPSSKITDSSGGSAEISGDILGFEYEDGSMTVTLYSLDPGEVVTVPVTIREPKLNSSELSYLTISVLETKSSQRLTTFSRP